MSGIEVAGLILGAFPVLISLIDYGSETKKYAGQFWRFSRAYLKQRNAVRHCQTLFQLHLHELLQPLLADEVVDCEEYDKLLQDPGGKGWDEEAIKVALSERLRGTHGQYLETLVNLQFVMVRLLDKWKVGDQKFKKYLDENKVAHGVNGDFMARATEIRERMALQPHKISHILNTMRREQLVEEVEVYVKHLQDQLAAAERVLHNEKISTRARGVPKAVLNFWRHASTVYGLLTGSLTCQCCSEYQAQVMLSQTSMVRADLGLRLRFTTQRGTCLQPRCCMKSIGIVLQDSSTSCECHAPNGSSSKGVVSGPPQHTQHSGPRIIVQAPNGGRVVPASLPLANTTSAAHISELCPEAALPHGKSCIGFLQTQQGMEQYHVRSAGHSTTILPRASIVCFGRDLAAQVPLVPRLNVAAMLVLACLKLQDTPWFAGDWTLDNSRIGLHVPDGGTFFALEAFIIANLTAIPSRAGSAGAAETDLWSLGVLLLELAYGRTLDEHSMWNSNGRNRDRTDPVLRRAVAQEWVKDIELQVPGNDYAHAVRWCLERSQMGNEHAHTWRRELALNVVLPLRQYAR